MVYQLDEHNETRNHFNLQYDSIMFFGLYSAQCHQSMTEPFPSGTQIQYTRPNHAPLDGYVIAVPDVKFTTDTARYTVRLSYHWNLPPTSQFDLGISCYLLHRSGKTQIPTTKSI